MVELPEPSPFSWSAPRGPAWPITPVRDRYVTPFGGVSWELEPFQIGVSESALKANTTLAGEERVIVAPIPEQGKRPLYTRAEYVVVPLKEDRPDALERGKHGEAVFSTYELDQDAPSLLQSLAPGTPVTLNATLARLGFTSDVLGDLRRSAT